MARDSNGNYTSPSGPFVNGTTIDADEVNAKLDDLGSEITNSLDRLGNGGMLARLRGVDGTVAAPAYSFTSETDLGFYRAGSGDLRLVDGASNVMKWSIAEVRIYAASTVIDGNLTVDSGTLRVDATNNRVGVGTATPNTLLAIGHAGVVDAVIPAQINAAAASEQYWGVNKAGALGFLVGYSNGAALGTRGAIRTVNNEPIGVYVSSNVEVAEFNGAGNTISLATAATATDPAAALTLTNGHLALGGAAPNSNEAVSNAVTPTNTIKACGYVVINAGAAFVNAGFNVSTAVVNLAGSTSLRVTFAAPFASDEYICVTSSNGQVVASVILQTATRVDIQLFDPVTNNIVDMLVGTGVVHFICVGAQ